MYIYISLQHAGKYAVWFNRSTDISEEEWMENKTKYYSIEELSAFSHAVTHLIIKYSIPLNIHTLFPHLTHLRVRHLKREADFSW